MSIVIVALNAAQKGGKALSNIIKNKYPNFTKNLILKTQKPLNRVLNRSKFNQKLVKGFDNCLKQNPKLQTAGVIIASTFAPAWALLTILKNNRIAVSAIEEAKHNYNFLSAINNAIPEKVEEHTNTAQEK